MNKTFTVTIGHKNVVVDATSPVEAATQAVEVLRNEDDFSIGLIISVADTELLETNKRMAEDETVFFLSSYILSNASMHEEARYLENVAKSLDDPV